LRAKILNLELLKMMIAQVIRVALIKESTRKVSWEKPLIKTFLLLVRGNYQGNSKILNTQEIKPN